METILALLPYALSLIGRGTELVSKLHQLGSQPGGPTDEQLRALFAEFDISDATLEQLLTGKANA